MLIQQKNIGLCNNGSQPQASQFFGFLTGYKARPTCANTLICY